MASRARSGASPAPRNLGFGASPSPADLGTPAHMDAAPLYLGPGSADMSCILPPERHDNAAVRAYGAKLRAWVDMQVDARLQSVLLNGFESELATASRQSGSALATCDRLQSEVAAAADSQSKLLAVVSGMSSEMSSLKLALEGPESPREKNSALMARLSRQEANIDQLRRSVEKNSALMGQLSQQDANIDQLRRSVDSFARRSDDFEEAASRDAEAQRRKTDADCREATLAVEKMAAMLQELQQSLSRDERQRLSCSDAGRSRLEIELGESRYSQERQQQRLDRLEACVERHEASLIQVSTAASDLQRKERAVEPARCVDAASMRQMQNLRDELDLKLSRWRSEVTLEVSKELFVQLEERSAALNGDLGERIGAQVRGASAELESLAAAHGEFKSRGASTEKELRNRIASIEKDQRNQLQDLQSRSQFAATQLQEDIRNFEGKMKQLVDTAINDRRGRLEEQIRKDLDERLRSLFDELALQAEASAAAGARAELESKRLVTARELHDHLVNFDEFRSSVQASQVRIEVSLESRLQDGLVDLKRNISATLQSETATLLRNELSAVKALDEQVWMTDQRLGQRIDELAIRSESSAAAAVRAELEVNKRGNDDARTELAASQRRIEREWESRLEDGLSEVQRRLRAELKTESASLLRSESAAVTALDEQLWLADRRLQQRIDELTQYCYSVLLPDGLSASQRRRHGGVRSSAGSPLQSPVPTIANS